MKCRIVTISLGLLLAVGSLSSCGGSSSTSATGATSQSLYIPADALTVEGNSADGSPFNTQARRFQTVYGTTALNGLPTGATITGMRFRLNGSATPLVDAMYAEFEIRLSASMNAPGALDATFANNRGADEVVVRTGAMGVAAMDYPSGSAPNGFGPVIAFSMPYVYAGGSLLLEIGFSGLTAGTGQQGDAVSGGGDTQSGYGDAAGINSTSADIGLFDFHAVVEYIYLAP